MIDFNSFPDPPAGKVGWPWCIPPYLKSKAEQNSRDYPKISIVTPSFNQGCFIEETIRSVLLQGYPNLEYVIIDGGSTDDTVRIIKKYEKYLHYWVTEKDHGQSHAINKGIEHCSGEIFNWLNSDDLLCEGALGLISKSFVSHSIDIFIAGCITFTNHFEFVNSSLFPERYRDANKLAGGGCVFQPAVFWNLEVLRRYLPVRADLHYIMDIDLRTRYFVENGIDRTYLSGMVACFYRLHQKSKTVAEGVKFQMESIRYASLLAKQNGRSSLASLASSYADERFGKPKGEMSELAFGPVHPTVSADLVALFFLNSTTSHKHLSFIEFLRVRRLLRKLLDDRVLSELIHTHFSQWQSSVSLKSFLVQKTKSIKSASLKWMRVSF